MSRALQLLRILEANYTRTATQLAGDLDVSTKTVTTTVGDLNLSLNGAGVITYSHGVYRLVVFRRDDYAATKSELEASARSFNDTDARQAHLFGRLIESDSPVAIEHVANEIKVSRSTIRADIDRLRALLDGYALGLEGRVNVGTSIVGPELNLRLVILDRFYQHLSDPNSVSPEAIDRLVDIAIEHQLEIPAIESLTQWFTVLLKRAGQGHLLTEMPAAHRELSANPASEIARKVVVLAEDVIGRPLPHPEVLFMTLPLVAMRGPNQLAPFAGFAQENEQAEVLAAIHERIEAEMGLDIRFQDLRDEFLLHIGFLVNRVRYDVQITEDAAGLVDRRYPLAFQMASLARAVIEEHTGRAIQGAEVSLLAAYFQVTIDDLQRRARREVRIAVVYPHGRVEGHLLKSQVESAVPDVTHVTPVALAEIDETTLTDYDLAILRPGSTILASIPTAEVGPDCEPRELRRIIDALSIQSSAGARGAFGGASWIATLLPENAFHRLRSSSYPENLSELLEALEAKSAISAKFARTMLEREERATMRISEELAFPHETDFSGRFTLAVGVSTAQTLAGVEPRVLVLAGFPPNSGESHSSALVGIYEEVMRLAQSPALLAEIASLEDTDAFRALMTSHISVHNETR